MRNFQNTFETRKRSFTSAFSNYMTVPLRMQNFYSFVVKISSLHLYTFKNRKILLKGKKTKNMTQNQDKKEIRPCRSPAIIFGLRCAYVIQGQSPCSSLM